VKPKVEAAAPTHWPETEIQRLNSELKATQEILRAFSHSISHDLRAPLRHIVGYVDILQSSAGPTLDPISRQHLDHVAQSARRMDRMFDAVLDWFRAGAAPMDRQPVNLAELVTEARQRLTEETPDRPMDWRIGDLPEAWGDPRMLREIIGSLLSNAIKFTRHRNRPRIEIGAKAGDGETIYFIRDNGIGFDMDRAGQLFGMFQRLHPAGEPEGLGTGLAKVRLLVNQHGGRTWAEAKRGQGATFYFSLPAGDDG
jgi:light-regulated signal transduction histidine kinase (bacteriophytochrome)